MAGACKSGSAATPRDLGLNKDETGAHILATFEAGMNSAADPGTVAVTH